MTILAICTTALSAFLLGLIIGSLKIKNRKDEKPVITERIICTAATNEEYKNFLSYDGSEQA